MGLTKQLSFRKSQQQQQRKSEDSEVEEQKQEYEDNYKRLKKDMRYENKHVSYVVETDVKKVQHEKLVDP